MPDIDAELLRQGIDRNLAAVLSLPSAGMLRHQKSRFLRNVEGGIYMEASANELALINELIKTQNPCGVAFRNGAFKVMFASAIQKYEPKLRISAEVAVDAVLLQFPKQIKSIQRRNNYRAPVLPDFDIFLRVWRIGDRTYLKEQPMSAQEIKVEIKNLSTGGVGVRMIGKDGQPPKVTPDDRLRVQLTWKDYNLLMEGRMRAVPPLPDNTIFTGIQFKKMENDIEGRQQLASLTRIVGELQRDEARRMRLGLVARAS